MTQVLVVCKTRMKTGLCVGGLVAGSYAKIRILTPTGHNQPEDTVFAVGDIWECQLESPRDTMKPHTEDMLVWPKQQVRRVPNMHEFITERLRIEPTHKSRLFEGRLHFTKPGSAYISQRASLPDHAHEFWRPVYGLRRRRERHKIYFEYEDPDSRQAFRMRFVGLDNPVARLEPGCLLHLSLARWWRQPGVNEERCYLQLSGYFI